MKAWFITLPLLCAASLVQADGMPSTPAEGEKMEAPAQQASQRKVRRLPRGDLRHCLDLTDNKEIIRCAETRRKR